MDTAKLFDWLGLPPGAWPPGPRDLLGLPPGPATAAAVERAALGQMAKLRVHQLLHPDLVTEGMNKLAQAMLTVPVAAVPKPAPPPVVAPPEFDFAPDAVASSPAAATPGRPAVAVAVPVPAAPAEVEWVVPPPVPAAPAPARVALPAPAVVAVAVPPVGVGKAGRRLAYRELVGLRRLAAAWDGLRDVAADPAGVLETPTAVCDFVQACAAFRAAVGHRGIDPAAVAGFAPRVLAVFAHPTPVAVVRSLDRPQRLAVAREWAAGRGRLAGWRGAARNALRAGRPGGTISRTAGRRVAWLAARPEWAVAAGTVAAVLVGAVRAAGRG